MVKAGTERVQSERDESMTDLLCVAVHSFIITQLNLSFHLLSRQVRITNTASTRVFQEYLKDVGREPPVSSCYKMQNKCIFEKLLLSGVSEKNTTW